MTLTARIHECSKATENGDVRMTACLIYTTDAGAEVFMEAVSVGFPEGSTSDSIRAAFAAIADATKARLQDADAIAAGLQGASL